jgi:DNA-binding NarL/FixJ family response regulator
MSIKVILADDHKMVRDGLRSILSLEPDIEVVGEAENGLSAVEGMDRLSPDVMIMDVSMPDLNGFEATRVITARHPGSKVVALSAYVDEQHVMGMLRSGAWAYVSKASASQELVAAIRAVTAGKKYLSPEVAGAVVNSCAGAVPPTELPARSALGARERQVVQLLAEGHSSKAIASLLHIATRTVESHRRNIMQKLMLHSVAELTKYALREGLTSLDN